MPSPIVLALSAESLVLVSYLLLSHARTTSVMIPVVFDTPYLAFRTVITLAFSAFFVVLVARHVLLMLFSVLDQIDRAVTDRRRARLAGPAFEPLVSVIAPAFNEGRCIEASIRSLLELDYPSYEVLVVDDGSTDDTLERARRMEGDHGGVRVQVLWKPNGGKASALNFGIERAAGELVTTMDSDSELDRGSLRAAVRWFEDANVGAVAGAVEVVNRRTLWGRLQHVEYTKGLNLVRRAQGFLRAVCIVPGPIGVFRKTALARVGGYDPDTFAEDCDVTLKLLLDGWKICYEPRAVARTEAPEGVVALVKQRYRWTRGVLQAIRKHRHALLPWRSGAVAATALWYMVFEALVWPVMTGVMLAFMLMAGLDSVLGPAATYFWIMLLVLDVATTMYCLALEEESMLYLLYAPLERMVFSVMLDVCRILASVEELCGLRMSWGKLERRGRA